MQIPVDRTVSESVAQKPITNKCISNANLAFFCFVLSDLSIQLWFETSAWIHNSVSLLHFQNKINRVDIENDAKRTSSI